ncbi:MAG: M20/M25/M40 family metallo-hydrolase [Acidobacteria bacterium]|nr:M20/M25/M40 family metallo-hydrolase [Acidobacteriota bacterium]
MVLRLPVAQTFKKATKILFVAHMDELGYAVRAIAADGRLEVQSRGGGITEFFSGHAVLVHSAKGIRPGVIELPAGWDQPNFEWPRGPQAAGGPTRVDVGARSPLEVAQLGIVVGDSITVPKKYRKLFGTRANGRSFDDRVGCASLISAVWALGATPNGSQAVPKNLPAEVIFVWSTQEEIGLNGAKAVADRLAAKGETPDYVFAVDTFVSSDSPLESKRFADAPIGKGFVIRAVDSSNITDRKYVDKLIALAKKNQIPVQYGVTGGGNDGAVFLRHDAVDIPISWPLRYSHSPGEVIDTRDLDALARIVAAIARSW